MWQILFAGMRTYAPYVTLPIAAVIGAVGFGIERSIRGREDTTPSRSSIKEERDERLLEQSTTEDATEVESLKQKSFIPRTVLDRTKPGRFTSWWIQAQLTFSFNSDSNYTSLQKIWIVAWNYYLQLTSSSILEYVWNFKTIIIPEASCCHLHKIAVNPYHGQEVKELMVNLQEILYK